MNYKGYIGNVTYDAQAKIFHGEVLNTRDVITFQGKSVEELEQVFVDSVDDYLDWCHEEGMSPEKPFSGKFNVRISPELHQEVSVKASLLKISQNKFIEQAIQKEVANV